MISYRVHWVTSCVIILFCAHYTLYFIKHFILTKTFDPPNNITKWVYISPFWTWENWDSKMLHSSSHRQWVVELVLKPHSLTEVHRFPPMLRRKQLYWKRFPPVSCNWSHKSNLQINNRALFPSIAAGSGRHDSSPGAAGCPGNPSAKTDTGCGTPTSAFVRGLESIWEMNHVRINCCLLVLFSFHFSLFSLNGGYKLYKLDHAD